MPSGFPPSGSRNSLSAKDLHYHQQQHQIQQNHQNWQHHQGQRREHRQKQWQQEQLLDTSSQSHTTPFTTRRGMNALWMGGSTHSSQKLVASASSGSLSTAESGGDASSSHAGQGLPGHAGANYYSSHHITPQKEELNEQIYYQQQYHRQQRLQQSSLVQKQQQQADALVLDAPSVISETSSHTTRLYASSSVSVDETSSIGGGSSIGVGAVRKILQAGRDQMAASRQGIGRSRRRGRSWQGQFGLADDASTVVSEPQQHTQKDESEGGTETAASFARTAPKAGFLHKLGQNIHQYKRRFFVLKPTTHLYYFVSPNDAEPRGCIDLDSVSTSTTIKEVETLPDGRFRFEIVISGRENVVYAGESHGGGLEKSDNPQVQRILLEARNKEIGQEWMTMLDKERLSRARSDIDTMERQKLDLQSRVDELEKQVEDFRLVEKDRDLAVQDAADWRKKFHRLDEAIRLLTRQVRRPPQIETSKCEFESDAEGSTLKEGNSATASNTDATTQSSEKREEACNTDTGERQSRKSTEKTAQVHVKSLDDNTTDDPPEGNDTLEKSRQPTEGTKLNLKTDTIAASDSSSSTSSMASHEDLLNISYEERLLEKMDLSETHFSSLSNACQRLRDNLIATSTEANTVLGDLNASNLKIQAHAKRMAKAERHLCKLWEENCEMRSALKRRNKERKVLVREVRSLRQKLQHIQKGEKVVPQQKDQTQNLAGRPPSGRSSFATPQDQAQVASRDAPQQQKGPSIGPKEQKLILELEEHVMSSLRLHEQFIMVNGGEKLGNEKRSPQSELKNNNSDNQYDQLQSSGPVGLESAETVKTKNRDRGKCNSPDSIKIDTTDPALEEGSRKEWPVLNEEGEIDECETLNMSLSPIAPTRLPMVQNRPRKTSTDEAQSEFAPRSSHTYETPARGHGLQQQDERMFYLSSHTISGKEDHERKGTEDSSLQSSLSAGLMNSKPMSVSGSEISTQTRSLHTNDLLTPDCSFSTFGTEDDRRRKHPLIRLDEDSEDQIQAHMFESSLKPESKKSMVTDNCRATSRLICPLADVHRTNKAHVESYDIGDGKVYHLTFYTKKIGIQFQKVPMSPPSSKGVLTEAMTADIRGNVNGGNCDSMKTAAELRRIASIAHHAKTHQDDHEDSGPCCPVARPVDIVLVCGFHGFDDINNKTRPKLGARLVAFDGISVEVGEWTFESIRKAIHARSRPLTLSFRNDFLTTKQRSILKKAVTDITATAPPPKPTLQYRTRLPRNPQTLFSEQHQTVDDHHGHSKASVHKSVVLAPSPARSLNYANVQSHRQQDHYNEDSESMRSFTSTSVSAVSSASLPQMPVGKNHYQTPTSEAGGSSIFSSTIGPLVSNIMSGLSKQADQQNEQFTPSYLQRDPESVDRSRHHHDFKAGLL